MTQARHEIPTHLNVEDRAFYGLTVRQVMYLTIGLSSGYGLWNGSAGLPLLLRAGLSAACMILALVFTLLHPYGRGLDEWAFVSLHYLTVRRVHVWRPGEDGPVVRDGTEGNWQELTPSLARKEKQP